MDIVVPVTAGASDYEQCRETTQIYYLTHAWVRDLKGPSSLIQSAYKTLLLSGVSQGELVIVVASPISSF